ncbi:MAG: RNA-directed DNA polymerase [Minisyncoccia bacterium]
MPNYTSTINEVLDRRNIQRAWRWIKSNPDRRYKGYFRDLYSNYLLIEDYIIKDLSEQIQKNIYEPSHGCKIFIPKPSGVLRPYTLLTIEDQIIYQAMTNVIAEHLFPKIKSNYYVKNFGNLYAGKSSVWFYRKWSDGYQQFNEMARESFKKGLVYTASFDLTACYDSIDHKVLRHFLKEINCDNEFIDLLTNCLSKWTGNESTQIYHNHGIPQGPLSSGILSEVVLKYFDVGYGSRPHIRYMRYVDDIRLFAKSEKELRKMLVRFDRLSKNIGLFPQSNKIKIHKVKDIENELKSISRPTDPPTEWRVTNQTKLRKKIISLTKEYKITNQTLFKFTLSQIIPSSQINYRIWRIFMEYPANFEAVFQYFQRYKFLPKTIVNLIIKEINSQPVYTTITAGLFETLDGRIRHDQKNRLNRLLKKEWHPRVLESEVALHIAIGKPIIRENLINTSKQMDFALRPKEWYVRSSLVQALDNDNLSPKRLTEIINEKIRDKSNDVACVAAVIMVKRELPIMGIKKNINLRAANILKESGLIERLPFGANWCSIEIYFNKWMNNEIKNINWRSIFGTDYEEARKKAFNCCRKAGIDITAWVNYMDVFNDLLLKSLFKHDVTIGNYTLGNIGGSVSSKNSRFERKYPLIFKMTKSIHEKRLESELSHAFTKSTKRATGPIKYSFYQREGRLLIKNAFKELEIKW